MAAAQDAFRGGVSGAIEVRAIDRASVEGVAALLTDLHVSFAGLASRSMARAICAEGIGNRRALILVARDGEHIAGTAIILIDAGRFWKGFAPRHPLLAFRIGRARWRRPEERTPAQSPAAGPALELPPVGPDTPCWEENGPLIAKVSFIGVAEPCRNRGVGRLLYLRAFEELARLGVRRVDARIDLHNAASIRLHQATGWTLYRDRSGVFATLPAPPAPSGR